jgi:hypothetical protein
VRLNKIYCDFIGKEQGREIYACVKSDPIILQFDLEITPWDAQK